MDFCLLASDAAVRVLLDVGLDVGPPIVPGDQFLGFITTWMSGGDSIVMCSDNIFTKFLVFGDVESLLPFDCGMRR